MTIGITQLNKAVEDRGARYCITGTIRGGEFAYRYAETGERAEEIRENYEQQHYRSVRVHPPTFDLDVTDELEKLGAERARLKQAEQEVTGKLRATIHRAAARGLAEADIARRANVDRMTVRKWLGKG